MLHFVKSLKKNSFTNNSSVLERDRLELELEVERERKRESTRCVKVVRRTRWRFVMKFFFFFFLNKKKD